MKKFFMASLVLGLSLVVGHLGVAGPLACVDKSGDSNGDNALDLSDAVYLLGHLFQGGSDPVPRCPPAGGPEVCDGLGVDEDGDGLTDCADDDCQTGTPPYFLTTLILGPSTPTYGMSRKARQE